MQVTCLLQLNNPPQQNYQHHNIECLRMLTNIEKKKKVINKYNSTKPKALKPSFTILRRVPLSKQETSKNTRNS